MAVAGDAPEPKFQVYVASSKVSTAVTLILSPTQIFGGKLKSATIPQSGSSQSVNPS